MLVALLAAALAGCGDRAAEDAVAATLPNPDSATFQAVREAGDHVCGEVNSRDGEGNLTGYARFVYDNGTKVALVDPRDASPALAPPDPACGKPLSYQSVAERLNCEAAPQLRGQADRQRDFDRLWAQACS